jgi:rhodanese-related sulfurtransferase
LIQRLNSEKVKEILEVDENIRLIDVREEWEYQKAKIENSELMPLSSFNTNLNNLSKDDNLIIYCHHGVRSLRVCNYLEKLGFKNLINLEGGIDAWSKEVDDSIPIY